MFMAMLTVSKAKANFSRVTRSVIKTKRPIVVKTPAGFVQIAPYELPEIVEPAPRGSLRSTPKEIRLSNTFGESL
jgi:hypothetical protein